MSELNIFISDKIAIPPEDARRFREFLQKMANRRTVGHLRYGSPKKEQRYMSRLGAELKAYRKTGNQEQLLNIAMYAFLESYKPENSKSHMDATADSVTRKHFGGNIA